MKYELYIEDATGTCAKGLGGACGHVIALLYQLVHYKGQGLRAIPVDVAKTSLPQLWDKPDRPSNISGQAIQDMVRIECNSKKAAGGTEGYFTGVRKDVKCTLYNPMRTALGSVQ